MELMERLAALVPPPRFNIIRYYGVLAPASSLRPYIVPQDKSEIAPAHPACLAKPEASATEEAEAKTKRSKKPRNYSWAQLLERVFEVDILICPPCGSKMRVLCAIHPPDAIKKILTCLGLPSRPHPSHPPGRSLLKTDYFGETSGETVLRPERMALGLVLPLAANPLGSIGLFKISY